MAIFLILFFRIPICIGHDAYTQTCICALLDASALLVRSVLMVYTLVLQDTGYVPNSVLPLRNIYGTLVTLEGGLFDKQDSNLHYTPPDGFSSRSSMTNHSYSRSPYKPAPCTRRRCMTLRFHLDVGTSSSQDLFSLH